MSAFQQLVERLDGVNRTGDDRCTARCPAHDDKHQSLSIREVRDGRVLVHCFAGCETFYVLAAIGLEFKDLYPEPLVHHAKPTKPNHWHAAMDALRAIKFESLIIVLSAESMASGKSLSDEDRDRLLVAANRVREAAEVVL